MSTKRFCIELDSVKHELQEEALYLKKETGSIASRYKHPFSRAPSDIDVTTDEDIGELGPSSVSGTRADRTMGG
jgi:hypothetical protein